MRIAIALLSLVVLAACAPKVPEWTRGTSTSAAHPAEHYLTGVGIDRERGRAEDRARAEIAKIFQVSILARETSSEVERSFRAGAAVEGEYRQSVQAELTAVTDKVLQGVTIAEVWREPRSGEFYALTVLDRRQAARSLRTELNELDERAMEQVLAAEKSPSPFRRIGLYLQALQALDKREGVAADLRIVGGGTVLPPPYSRADVAGRLDRTAAALGVAVELENDRQRIVETSLIRALAGTGFRIVSVAEADLIVGGEVNVEAYRSQDPWHWTMADAQVRCGEKEGLILDALRASVREGSRHPERSETLAREKLGERLADLLLEQLFFPERKPGARR